MSWHFGPSVYTSDDLGGTWREPEPTTLRFPADTGASVARVWQLVPAADEAPDVVYAGVEPAALFRSDDGGDSFSLVRVLWDHPHREQWQPGGGGLCLPHDRPRRHRRARMGIAVSAAGFYRTLDGTDLGGRQQGDPPAVPAAARARVRPVRAQGGPAPDPARHAGSSSTTGASTGPTTSVARGYEIGEQTLPSTFGFPIVVDPNDPDTAYVIPLKSDFFRCAAEGKLRVFRTTDGGDTWEPSGTAPARRRRLPERAARRLRLRRHGTGRALPRHPHRRVLRLARRRRDVVELTRHLPPVLCVKATVLA